MRFRISDIKKLEKAQTNVNAIHMTAATLICVVTASAEQIPSICKPIGLLLKIGFNRISFTFDITDPFALTPDAT